jgi:hypothetical protein
MNKECNFTDKVNILKRIFGKFGSMNILNNLVLINCTKHMIHFSKSNLYHKKNIFHLSCTNCNNLEKGYTKCMMSYSNRIYFSNASINLDCILNNLKKRLHTGSIILSSDKMMYHKLSNL